MITLFCDCDWSAAVAAAGGLSSATHPPPVVVVACGSTHHPPPGGMQGPKLPPEAIFDVFQHSEHLTAVCCLYHDCSAPTTGSAQRAELLEAFALAARYIGATLPPAATRTPATTVPPATVDSALYRRRHTWCQPR